MTTIQLVDRTGAAVASADIPASFPANRPPQLADFASRIAARYGHAGAVLSKDGAR